MRKRFNLPANDFCCGKPAVTDCFQWLCCCACSLAQEVRTADYYDVVDDKLYPKQMSGDNRQVMSSLPREDGSTLFKSSPSSPYWGNSNTSYFTMQHSPSPSRVPDGHSSDKHLPMAEEGSSMGGKNDTMKPPVTPVIQRENNILL